MKRSHRKWLLYLAGGMLLGPIFLSNALAQDLSVSAEVNTQKTSLDSAIQLSITINGTQNLSPVTLPAIDGFDVRYLGPSRRVSIVNGQYSSSIAFMYTLYPAKVGSFQIPAMTLNIEGKTFTTDPITVEVVDTPSAAPDANQMPQTQTVSLKDKIFVQLKTAKDKAYINEAVPVKIFLYMAGLSVRDIQFPKLDNLGFFVEEFSRPSQYEQVINGVRYSIIEFDTTVYPSRAGKLTLGPTTIDCNILMSAGTRNQMSGLFDDDFFNSFFNQYEKRPVTLQSQAVDLEVLDLPQENKPADFTGGVGNFSFDVSIGPQSVKVGDPITVKMKVQGEGYLGAVKLPVFKEDQNFKVYEPVFKEEGRSRILEQVLIPKKESVHEVPAVVFCYFNPNLAKYLSIAKGPFPISVEKLTGEEQLKVVAPAPQIPVNEIIPQTIGEDIVYLKEDIGQLRVKGKTVFSSLWYWLLWGGMFTGWIGSIVFYRHTHKLQTDARYAKKLLAPQKAKKGLQAAQALISSAQQRSFYDTLFKSLQEYMNHKLHLPYGDISVQSIRSKMGDPLRHESVLRELQTVFDECEQSRYASATFAPDKLRQTYEKVESIIDYFERHMK